MAADRENRGSRQPQTCPMEADAAQMKAEWELGILPLPIIFRRSRFRLVTQCSSVFSTWAADQARIARSRVRFPVKKPV